MATLAERLAVLEARVDELTVRTERNGDIATSAYREAMDARLWPKHNVELLRALRETQMQHSEILDEHTQMLTEHGRLLAEHGLRLSAIEGRLGTITVGVHDIQLMLKHLVEREGGEGPSGG